MDMGRMHARRLLSHAPAATPAVAAPGPSGQTPPSSPFGSVDATVISILSLLFCVLIVALVVRALVQCACRVTRRVCYGPAEPPVDAEAGGLETAPPRDGAAGAGGKKKRAGKGDAIRAIPTIEYSAEIELAVCCSTECAICLADLKQGERVRVLSRCHHGFHVRCIDRWLSARQTCPTCRQEPFALPTRPEEPAPAPAAVQVHVDAAQLETI